MKGNDGFWNVLTAGMDAKKENQERPFNVGISSIMFASLSGAFWPNPLVVGFFFIAGFGLIVMDFIDLNDKTKELMRNLKIKNVDDKYPIKLSKTKQEYGYDLRFSVPTGLDIEDFSKHQRAWETALKHRVAFTYDKSYNVIVKVYASDLKSKYPFELIPTNHIMKIPIGKTFGDVAVIVDLVDTPNVLIAGNVGAGKSFILRVIISTLLLRGGSKLYLCDLKGGVELDEFKEYETVESFCTEISEMEKVLRRLLILCDERAELFRKSGSKIKKIADYNEAFPDKKLDYHVVAIDELADFIGNNTAQQLLDTLAQKGRFAGVRIVGACQKPDSEVIKTRTRNNFPIKIGLTVTKNNDSMVICDDTCLTQLKGNGHAMIFDKGGDPIEFRGFFLTGSEELLKDIPKKEIKEEVQEEESDEVDTFDFLRE